MSITTEFPPPAFDPSGPKLNKAAGRVQAVFDVLAFIIAAIGALVVVGLLITTIAGSPDEAGIGIGLTLGAVIYTVLIWAVVKFYAIIAGYIHWKTK